MRLNGYVSLLKYSLGVKPACTCVSSLLVTFAIFLSTTTAPTPPTTPTTAFGAIHRPLSYAKTMASFSFTFSGMRYIWYINQYFPCSSVPACWRYPCPMNTVFGGIVTPFILSALITLSFTSWGGGEHNIVCPRNMRTMTWLGTNWQLQRNQGTSLCHAPSWYCQPPPQHDFLIEKCTSCCRQPKPILPTLGEVSQIQQPSNPHVEFCT